MEENSVSQGEVFRTLDKIKEIVVKNPEDVKKHIFNAMNEFATILLNKPQEQKGGAQDMLAYRPTVNQDLVTPIIPSIPLDAISIDGTYKKIKKGLQDLDAKNREIASIVGPIAFIHKMENDPGLGPLPPYLPVRLTISKNAIIPTVTYITEAIRLMATYGPLKSEFLRKILSLSLGIFDIVNGEWKNGVLSLLGLFGETPLLIGVIGRVLRQIWNFVSPDIQNDLEDTLFNASKSLFSGFWLAMVSTFAPESFRESIDSVLGQLRPLAEDINKQFETAEKIAQASASKLGLSIKFPRVDLNEIPSSDDLQNLLSILRRKEVICNSSSRQILQPLLSQPIFRLLLELFNIPSSEEAFGEKCADVDTDLSKSISDSVKPIITPMPMPTVQPIKGGANNENKIKQILEVLPEFPVGNRSRKKSSVKSMKGGENKIKQILEVLPEFPVGNRSRKAKRILEDED